jgi:hypothetical protein
VERSFAPLAFLAVVGSSVAIASAGCDVCGSQQECGVIAATNDGAVSGGNPCHPQDGAPYPTTGCGFGKGLVIDDYAWTGRLAGISSPVTTLKLHDYYNPDGSKPAKYLFMTVSAFWCQACKDEAKHLNALFDKYAGRVLVVTDIAQKVDRSITDQTDVDVWIKSFALHTAVVTDPGFVLQNFFEPSTMPLDLIIDLKTMTVVYDTTGAVLPSVESFLDSAP